MKDPFEDQGPKTALVKEKEALERKLAELADEQAEAEKRLNRLTRVQDLPDPAKGTVIRFTLTYSGRSSYTFVAYKASIWEKSWSVTGKKNSLNYFGLRESGNSWSELLLAIGDARIEFATQWSDSNEPNAYEYFVGDGTGRIFRGNVASNKVEVRSPQSEEWAPYKNISLGWLRGNPSTYRPTPNPEKV